MMPHAATVQASLELLSEMGELRRLGLSDEEVEGFVEFFKENYPELYSEVSYDLQRNSQVPVSPTTG